MKAPQAAGRPRVHQRMERPPTWGELAGSAWLSKTAYCRCVGIEKDLTMAQDGCRRYQNLMISFVPDPVAHGMGPTQGINGVAAGPGAPRQADTHRSAQAPLSGDKTRNKGAHHGEQTALALRACITPQQTE